MTPEEILRDLRDIHLPANQASTPGDALVLWPLLLVLVAALIMAWLAWWRRTAWRREASRLLAEIEADARRGRTCQAWQQLADLLRRLAIQRAGRRRIAGLCGTPWLRMLDRQLGTDIFERGPGRGLITFPYRGPDGGDSDGRMAADLAATIAAIQDRLPQIGGAR